MANAPSSGNADHWKPGDWNINCSMCGMKMKAMEAVHNWQGTWRHEHCNEPRPAQDFVHAIRQPEMVVPFSQKMAEIDIQICTLNGISSIAGYSVGGCWLAGRTGPLAEGLPELQIITG
jgi:hypothetical protein